MNINEFHDVVEIGHGGMGTVYMGFSRDGRKVAIKEIRRDYLSERELIDRFRLEATVIDKLNHPSIVRIVKPGHYQDMTYYPAFEENGNLYLAMEFIEGETLDRYVKHYPGGIPESEAVSIMVRILDVMEYVRLQNLVHRDIKPSNIFIRPDKSPCLIDFGIAKDINSSGLTTGRCILGTSGYMSPEQAQGGLTIDTRTDIYSLGCVLFYMLTGRNAIQTQASDFETRIAVLNTEFPRVRDYNPNVSERIQDVIGKAVDKNMLLRYQTPAEFKRALLYDGVTVLDPGMDAPRSISIGRDPGCDLPVPDPQGRVSRRHMDIFWETVSDGVLYTFNDRSTNGSMVNEKFIRRQSCTLLDSSRSGGSFAPTVILAGAVVLDWNNVRAAIDRAGGIPAVSDPLSEAGSNTLDPVSEVYDNDSLGAGWALLSLLCPIVGWCLYAKYKPLYPNKAKSAWIVSWVGFALSAMVYLIGSI